MIDRSRIFDLDWVLHFHYCFEEKEGRWHRHSDGNNGTKMGLGVEICGDLCTVIMRLLIVVNNLIISDMFYGIGGEKVREIRDSGGLR